MEQAPPFEELIESAHHDAVHLEMRDFYTPHDPIFLDWKAGKQFDPAEVMADWYQTVRSAVAPHRACPLAQSLKKLLTTHKGIRMHLRMPEKTMPGMCFVPGARTQTFGPQQS